MANTSVSYTQNASRRDVLIGGLGTMAAVTLPAVALASTQAASRNNGQGTATMSTITTKDGTRIHYADGGKGQPVLFSHGWPLAGDAWDGQQLFMGLNGYRVIAHDRRSHGRSDQTWDGNHMDQYADDLAELIESLNLRDVILVGHSTGGGEITRYVGRHGTGRVAKMVLVGAVPPQMLKSAAYPGGLPIDVFDGIRKGVAANRSQFYKDLPTPFYGFNRPGAKLSEGLRDSFWRMGMMGGMKGQYDCIKQFSETDFTQDLKRIDVPTLIVHGSDDQIVPIGNAGILSAKLVAGSTLKIYEGADHGLAQSQPDRFNAELLAFAKA
jgi:non-heme chloroperoxidase